MNIKNYSKSIFISFGIFLVLVIGVIRYLTGPELALSLFFLFPIALVTWQVGRWAGILISIASTLSWLVADLLMLGSFSNAFIPYLNETFRLVVFLIITHTVFELRTALENLRELAGTDPLTSVANRRAFHNLANMELNKARRYQTPISVLYLDIDNFKQINDNFGHPTGDKLLGAVARTIKNNIRAIDIVARLGGDEFGILLAETAADSAALVAEKLTKKLLELMQDNGWPVTLSVGAVTFEILPDSVDEMISTADSQMYIAKKHGKNRIQYKIIVKNEDIYWTSTSAAL
ncbi:GGDEF domain-containing protein [Thermodesulfobacteriota bacterium]